jgi:hypothetical protein
MLHDRSKYYMKLSSKVKTKKGKKCIKTLIKLKEWPVGGISELQQYVTDEADEWRRWVILK